LPVKIIITALTASLGGATVLGLISELAAYNYAHTNGARIPFEGLPYIRFNVTLLSFLLISSSIFIFLLLGYLIKLSINVGIKHLDPENKDIDLERIPLKNYLKIVTIPAFAASQLLTSILIQFRELIVVPNVYLESLVYFLPAIFMLFVIRFQRQLKYILIFFYLALIGYITLNLFDQDRYSLFLAELKHGGNIPISIFYQCDNKPCELTDQKLFLITETHFILETTEKFYEIPKTKITNISYHK
jgi:hypothetical protein